MLRLGGGLFAMLLYLSACATVASGPRLSPAKVRRIADAEVSRLMKVDPRQYEASEPAYIYRGDYWLVAYYLKSDKRMVFTVRVSDKLPKVSLNENDTGVFEGGLTEKANFH